jgi:hypothetical protein
VSSMDQFSEGKCRGLQSRLELLADMDDSTRDVAIKSFTYMTDYELDDDDGVDPAGPGGGSEASAPGGNGLNQKTKSILISPALIYKEKIEPTNSNSQQTPVPPKKAAIELPSSTTGLPEEDLIRRQKWSCYGSTEVELLVLKNLSTGNEHIAAVAPRNVGVSVRKIDADDGSITSIGIGWLNIVVDAGPSFLDDDEDDEDVEGVPNDERDRQSNPLNSRSPLPQQKDSDQLAPSSSPSPEEVPPRPSQDSIVRTRAQLKKFYEFVGKVGDQMASNVNFLKDTMQDDFVKRSIAAGHKIVDNVPRTVDRTATFVQKMLDRLTGNGGGDGDGDNDRGGGGGRGPGP